MAELSGKTILITGASQGIGLAMGLRFAKTGATIVIAANEAVSIEAAATAIQHAGGNAIPLVIDVRDEAAVKNGIQSVIAQTKVIDVLINNVAAFNFSDTVDITAEQFDLLFSVNTRATFLLSKVCFDYLKQATNPHIINIAPPLDMQSRWFKNHLAFTLSKYAMSMCTLGMAEEFKSAGIAVNSLWPQTTIATTTIKEHFQPEIYAGSRWPTIMADAAYELARRSAKQTTGHFYLDEVLLREAGVTDFSQYAVDPTALLVRDLFVTASKESMQELVPDAYLK